MRSLVLTTLAACAAVCSAGDFVGVNESAHTPQHPEQRLDDLAARGRGWRNGRLGLTAGGGDFYPLGRYELRWEGQGEVSLGGGKDAVWLLQEHRNRRVYQVHAHRPVGLYLRCAGAEPTSVSLRCTSVETEGPFTRAFLDDLRRFAVWRTMDLAQTNGSTQSDWEDRPTLDGPAGQWVELGWPWELQVDAANRAGIDLWVCVPHAATDAYVRGLALLVSEQLDPERTLWLEYSNEVWNTARAFEQSRWVLANLVDGAPSQRHAAYGRRAAEVWKLFADAAPEVRLRRVLAGQAGNPRVLREALQGAAGVAGSEPDALSVAAYFNPGKEGLYEHFQTHGPDADDALRRMRQSVTERRRPWWEEHGRLARDAGLPLVAYEGGQHIAAAAGPERRDAAYVAWLAELNRAPLLRDAYGELRRTWREAGGDGIVYFSRVYGPSRYGSWGHRHHARDNDNPKNLALEDHLAEAAEANARNAAGP